MTDERKREIAIKVVNLLATEKCPIMAVDDILSVACNLANNGVVASITVPSQLDQTTRIEK